MTAVPATLTSALSHLRLKYSARTPVYQGNKRYPFLMAIRKEESVNEEAGASAPLDFDRTDHASADVWANPGDNYPDEQTGPRKFATFAWSEVQLTAGVTDLAAKVAAQNDFVDDATLEQSEAGKAAHTIYSRLNTGCYTGNYAASPPQLAGLTAAATAGTSSNAFGGVDPATTGLSEWAGLSRTKTLAEFNADPLGFVLQHGIQPITNNGGSAAFCFCNSDYIVTLMKRIHNAENHMEMMVRMIDGREVRASMLGTTVVKYRNTWFVDDPDAPASKLHFVSPEDFVLKYLPAEVDYAEVAATLSRTLGNVTPSAVEEMIRGETDSPALPPLSLHLLGRQATKRKVGLSNQMQIAWSARRRQNIVTLG